MKHSGKGSAFEQATESHQAGFLREFFDFLKNNKRFYLIPIAVLLFMTGLLIMLGGTAAAPFIYTLF